MIQVFSQRRIARSLVTILLLGFIQTVVAPIFVPQIATPKAEAVTATITPQSNASGTYIIIPSGVTSIQIEATGGAGGKGGDDVNIGKLGSLAGHVLATFNVTPGDIIGLYPGESGTAGASCATANGKGIGGKDTFPDGVFALNGTNKVGLNFSGGDGGNAGNYGCSGAGGAGGAASIATINNEIVVVAGGAGGGGGAGSGTNYAVNWADGLDSKTVSLASYLGTTESGTPGAVPTDSGCYKTAAPTGYDGGGGGGGGGGLKGGLGGTAPNRSGECSGTGGSLGSNYLFSGGTSLANDRVYQNVNGSVTYTFTYAAVGACSSTQQTYDIYTILTFTTTAPCTWTVPAGVGVIDVFAVGGGGGGSGDGGGGGAGGSALSRTAVPVTPGNSVTVKVGAGGGPGSWGWSIYNGLTGDSSTVSIQSGAFLAALGGLGGTGGPSGAGGIESAPLNGTFAGGAGGAGGACTGVGSAGKRGVTNYYLGTQSIYAGGGGGGSCPNAVTTAASGTDGGGNGGYQSAVATNQPGSPGTANTGGGGGGGIATGSGLKINGGKGGSGIVLIRYATNSANAFPSSLASDVKQRWLPENFQKLDTARFGWIDGSGTNSSTRTTTGTGFTIDTSTIGNASTKSFLTLKGATTESVKLANLPSDNKYTLFHVARYQSTSSTGRIFASSSGDWLSGFHGGKNGVAAHNVDWLTKSSANYSATADWLLSADQNYLYRANGQTKNDNVYVSQSVVNDFGINVLASQQSSWQVADVIVFNRVLTSGEIKTMESYLARIYGLTLATTDDSNETDTALTLDGTNYLYSAGSVQLSLADTFAFETWVKPGSSCQSGNYDCYIFSQKSNFALTIYNGELQYLLQPPTGSAAWITATNVKFPADEWHHLAVIKDGVANTAASLKIYFDGNLVYTTPYDPYTGTNIAYDSSKLVSPSGYETFIGYHQDDASQKFVGSIDEVKIWSISRTQSQILSDMHNAAKGIESNLQLYLDFNKNSLTTQNFVTNRAANGSAAFDMQVAAGTVAYSKIESVVTGTTYTTITFPRTIINQNGGWKVPSGISRVQTAIIGGGGGGGGGYEGGGGGAGGLIETITTLNAGDTYTIKIGTGGRGATNQTPAAASLIPIMIPTNGDTTTAFGLNAIGGGRGSYEIYQTNGAATSGGSGGGGSWIALSGASGTANQGNSGGSSSDFSASSPAAYAGAGGGGAGTVGQNATATKGGDGGAGKNSLVLNSVVAAGGGGSIRRAIASPYDGTTANQGAGGSSIGGNSGYLNNASVGVTGGASNGKYGTGSGGGGGYTMDPTTYSGNGGAGGTGVIALRYITATVPTYTKPTNITIDVGQYETFTTNVAQDSATASGLTRTFKWESTTAGANGSYTFIKQGTGAANASFSWLPSDTSTSGSSYLYRLTVTDSDTAGLLISDSSTAYATINGAMSYTNVSNTTTFVKKINTKLSETFTVSLGTVPYKISLSSPTTGITVETTTSTNAILKVADTTTVGTYYVTLIVTDSVSATLNIPVTVKVVAPPAMGYQFLFKQDNLVFNIDTANSNSVKPGGSVPVDISGAQRALTFNGTGSLTYSPENYGTLKFDPTKNQYLSAAGMPKMDSWTVEAMIRLDTPVTNGSCIISPNYTASTQAMNFYLCVDVGGILWTGYRTTSGLVYARAVNDTMTVGSWVHVAGRFNGTEITIYVNGHIGGFNTVVANGGSPIPAPASTLSGLIVGRYFDTNYSYYLPATIGFIHIYNIGLSNAEMQSNFDTEIPRFWQVVSTILTQTIKYGTSGTITSIDVASSSGSINIAPGIGNRTGFSWGASSTTYQLLVNIFAKPGTYYETVTATDQLGQSSYLPLVTTVTKADTLTVTVETLTSVVYSGNPLIRTPNVTIAGLVGADTLTATVKYQSPGTCALGGVCKIGDVGPGGGNIFYISNTSIDAATGISSGGIYLEAAPRNWNGNGSGEASSSFATKLDSIVGTSSAIGTGAENTRLAIAAIGESATAATLAANKTFNGLSDWFVPSYNELTQMITVLKPLGLGSFDNPVNLWSSTQSTTTSRGYNAWSSNPPVLNDLLKSDNYYLRPIRAFSPSLTYDTTTVPSEVETYTTIAVLDTSTGTNLDDYVFVDYQNGSVAITKAKQQKLLLTNLYDAYKNVPFTMAISGGSGTGARSETVTAGVGCSISGLVVTSAQGNQCSVRIVKLGDRNYYGDTLTADIYFMNFVINQPTNQVGSGTSIGLNGMTTFTVTDTSTGAIPTIISKTYASGFCSMFGCTPAHWVLIGSGFGPSGNTNIVVKFWRNLTLDWSLINNTVINDTEINIATLPTGWRVGPIEITTPYGVAVSDFDFDGIG